MQAGAKKLIVLAILISAWNNLRVDNLAVGTGVKRNLLAVCLGGMSIVKAPALRAGQQGA